MQQGVSKQRILNDIREEATNQCSQDFKRHHLATKKDLNNIEKSFGLDTISRHGDDQMSCQAMIEELKNSENDPVLFSKFQGQDLEGEFNLAKEDFAIVIQSPFQKMMAQKFAHKGICVDSTHGTTAYDFLLTSVVVVDEFGEGVPIAWLLSNHEDFTHMCLFFNILKQNCGILSPQWIMSDMANQYFNA